LHALLSSFSILTPITLLAKRYTRTKPTSIATTINTGVYTPTMASAPINFVSPVRQTFMKSHRQCKNMGAMSERVSR